MDLFFLKETVEFTHPSQLKGE